jgi:SAM-dependent methyltransferase
LGRRFLAGSCDLLAGLRESAAVRLDKTANRVYSDEHRLDERQRFLVEPSRRNAERLLVPWITSHLREGSSLIDIAGGVGTYASLIAQARKIEVVGVDISPALVALRDEDPWLAENVVADMEDLPFDAERFDSALFVAALHHVPDPLPALREAARVLRPGGQLFAFEPTSLRAHGRSVSTPGAPHEFLLSRRWLLQRTAEAGFVIEEARGCRIAMRVLRRVGMFAEQVRTSTGEPAAGSGPRGVSAAAWRLGDRLDEKVLGRLPLLDRLGETILLRARKP